MNVATIHDLRRVATVFFCVGWLIGMVVGYLVAGA